MKFQKTSYQIIRVIKIVKRLYEFEYLDLSSIAQEYGVSERTIRRDLEKIKESGIELRANKGVYSLVSSQITKGSKFPSALIHSFASNVGLNINCIDDSLNELPVISFAIAYGGIDKDIAEAIIESIEKGCKCQFIYTNNKGIKSIRSVSPIKLYTAKGKWYLLAKDDKSRDIRLFDFIKIKNFEALSSIKSELTKEDIKSAQLRPSIWSSSSAKSFEVLIVASEYASRYLKEVPMHPTQKVFAIHSDGSVEFIYTITNKMEILPEIKNWIPHIHIIEPKYLRDSIKKDIVSYLQEIDLIDI